MISARSFLHLHKIQRLARLRLNLSILTIRTSLNQLDILVDDNGDTESCITPCSPRHDSDGQHAITPSVRCVDTWRIQ